METSGGPIVDNDGQILAVMSIAGGSHGETKSGPRSIPSLWLLASVPGEERAEIADLKSGF